MGPAFWDELPQVFAALDQDPEVRAIVLAADGPVWTAGLDLVGVMPLVQTQDGGAIAAKRHLLKLIQRFQMRSPASSARDNRSLPPSTASASAAAWI